MKSPTLWFAIYTILLWSLSACASKPKGSYDVELQPIPPNYSNVRHWAAHPYRIDSADVSPSPFFKDKQFLSNVDVFFIHPTTYINKAGNTNWNGPIEDRELNDRTERTTILYQATIFNGVGRIFAPHYRQAHLHAYYCNDYELDDARKALELAYSDVRRAFKHYLDNFNFGRPILIASHSQGAQHGARLLKEFFDGKPLQDQLVAAYLVGMPIPNDFFASIKGCEEEAETGCFCSWRTFKKNSYPKDHIPENDIFVTNPLSWTTTEDYAPEHLNEGAIVTKFGNIIAGVADAEVHDGILWANKPKFPGSILFLRKNYHIGDLNLYYINVRKNAILRATAYLRERGMIP